MVEQKKRYYWIKLREDFYAEDGPADFLMSQKDGANYVVLYQMLCLKTINSGGRLENQIGSVMIRYDIDKIQRIGKYFSIDTVRTALQLYKALGLIYEECDGTMTISGYNNMVGNESDGAERKRRQRLKAKGGALPSHVEQSNEVETNVDKSSDNVCDNVTDNVTDNVRDNVHIRDKEIKILRDKEIKSVDTENLSISKEIDCRDLASRRDDNDMVVSVINAWNSLGLNRLERIYKNSKRGEMTLKRIRDYGIEKVLLAIENVRNSQFLLGNNKKGWTATYDWFIRPENFQKTLEGNYNDRGSPRFGGTGNPFIDSLEGDGYEFTAD